MPRFALRRPSALRRAVRFLVHVPALLVALLASACSDDPHLIPAYVALRDLDSAPAAIRAASEAVVRIQVGHAYGTGVFLSKDGLLLTNNHVLGIDVCPIEGCYATLAIDFQRGATRVQGVVGGEPNTTSVFVIPTHVDVGLDMTVVRVFLSPTGPSFTPRATIEIADVEASALLDSRVYVVGHPLGALKKWSTGTVADVSGAWIVASAFGLPGNSGSPILDAQGRLVALLHRGPASVELVAGEDFEGYSVGSAGGPLLRALDAPLPDAMRSLADVVSADDVTEHAVVYRNADASTANVGGTPTSVVDILAASCDAALARTDFVSPEDFDAAVDACFAALDFLACGAGPDTRLCDGTMSLDAWIARLDAIDARSRALTGAISYRALVHAVRSLPGGDVLARDRMQALVDSKVVTALEPELAYALAVVRIPALGTERLVDYVRGYAKNPAYLYASQYLVATIVYLGNGGPLLPNDALSLLGKVARDTSIPLGGHLFVDEVLWEFGR